MQYNPSILTTECVNVDSALVASPIIYNNINGVVTMNGLVKVKPVSTGLAKVYFEAPTQDPDSFGTGFGISAVSGDKCNAYISPLEIGGIETFCITIDAYCSTTDEQYFSFQTAYSQP